MLKRPFTWSIIFTDEVKFCAERNKTCIFYRWSTFRFLSFYFWLSPLVCLMRGYIFLRWFFYKISQWRNEGMGHLFGRQHQGSAKMTHVYEAHFPPLYTGAIKILRARWRCRSKKGRQDERGVCVAQESLGTPLRLAIVSTRQCK